MTPSVGHAHPAPASRAQRAREAAAVSHRTQRLQALGFSPPDAHLLAHDASLDMGLMDTLSSQGHCPVSALHIARQQAAQRILERFAILAWARVPLALQPRIAADERYDLAQLTDLVNRGCDPELAIRIIAPDTEPGHCTRDEAHHPPVGADPQAVAA
jgi:hypothetical protein